MKYAHFIIYALAVLLAGCTVTSVYVPHGRAVQLRGKLKNVKVWVRTKSGLEPAVMDIPEGWYCLPNAEGE